MHQEESTQLTRGGSRRWWALAALALGSLIVNVDSTILNLALPTLSSALHASTAQLQWFIDAYTLVMAGFMLPAGLLGDRFGRKRLMVVALCLFGGASVACAAASSPAMFIAARAAAGLGAALFIPLGMAVLTVLFDEHERPRAVTILVGMSMAASPIGPIVGGLLLEHFWWGSVFLINVPIVAIALGVLLWFLPESRAERAPSFDVPGVLGSSAALLALVYGIIEAGQNGWGSTVAIVALAGGVLLLTAFVAWELRLQHRPGGRPLVDLGLFRSAGFTWGTLLATVMTFALFGLSFVGPQFFQAIKDISPQGNGLRMLATVVGLLVGAALGNRLLDRVGAKLTAAGGFALLAAGLFIGAFTQTTSGDAFVLGWMGVVGAGVGFILPATMSAALAALPTEHAGVGSSLVMAVRMVGGAFGVAILGSILNSVYQDHVRLGDLSAGLTDAVKKSVYDGLGVAQRLDSPSLLDHVRSAFMSGMDTMLVICGGIAVVGAVLALVFMPRTVAQASGGGVAGTTREGGGPAVTGEVEAAGGEAR